MKGDCMRKIGLVGGTGPESNIMYYKKLNSDIDKLTEGKTMPDIAKTLSEEHKRHKKGPPLP